MLNMRFIGLPIIKRCCPPTVWLNDRIWDRSQCKASHGHFAHVFQCFIISSWDQNDLLENALSPIVYNILSTVNVLIRLVKSKSLNTIRDLYWWYRPSSFHFNLSLKNVFFRDVLVKYLVEINMSKLCESWVALINEVRCLYSDLKWILLTCPGKHLAETCIPF